VIRRYNRDCTRFFAGDIVSFAGKTGQSINLFDEKTDEIVVANTKDKATVLKATKSTNSQTVFILYNKRVCYCLSTMLIKYG